MTRHLELKNRIRCRGWIILIIVGAFFILPFPSCCWNCLRATVKSWIQDLGIDLSSVYTTLWKERSFIGTATWTFTAVLSAFLVSFYSQQAAEHYGISTRKTIAATIGSMTIPICIITNFVIVTMMTIDYYLNRLAVFYYHAFLTLGLQAALSWLCILLTSDAFNARTIRKLEIEWLHEEIRKRNDQKVEKGYDESYYNTIPLILKGSEMVSDRLRLVEKILEELNPTGTYEEDSAYLRYQKDTIKHIADWAEEEDINVRLIFDSLQRVIGRLERKAENKEYRFSIERSCTITPRTAILLSFMRVAMQKERFQGLWSFILTNFTRKNDYKKKLAYYLAKTTFVFTLQKEWDDTVDKTGEIFESDNGICQWESILGISLDDDKPFQIAMKEWTKFMMSEYSEADDKMMESIVNEAYESVELSIPAYLRIEERKRLIYSR